MKSQIEKDIDNILAEYALERQENLIPILQAIQDKIGYIPEFSIKKITHFLKIPSSEIYGVATFYNQFRFKPTSKYHIQICYGTACYLFGASTLLKEIERLINTNDTDNDLFSIELTGCIGGCGHAPVIAINGEYYSNLTLEKLTAIIDKIKMEESSKPI